MARNRTAGLLFAGLAALSVSACGRAPKAPNSPSAFPNPTNALSNYIMGTAGLQPLPAGTVPAPAAGSQAPLAQRVSSLAINPNHPDLILAALNRYGLGMVEFSPDRSSYRIVNKPLKEMSGQSVAALWPRPSSSPLPGKSSHPGSDFLLELYRDPFIPGAMPKSDIAPELVSISASGITTVLDRIGRPEEELFALFPGPRGRWYAELRTEGALGAKLRYLSLASPEEASISATANPSGATSGTELRRDLFEANLAPRPLNLAPAALRQAAEAFEIPVLVHSRGESGSDAYWISAGATDEATEINAWITAREEDVIALDRSGRGIYLSTKAGGISRFSLSPPLPDADFTAVVSLSPLPRTSQAQADKTSKTEAQSIPACILAASWETGTFPTVNQSGLTITSLIP